jgi:hypothetical protein
LRSAGLQRLIRQEWEHQRYFPLPVATKLSQQFAGHGLQFFKVDRTFTHVSVARPQFLDIDSSPVSDGIKRIVQFINAHPKCTRKKLIEGLAPTPKAAPAAPAPAAIIAPTPAAAIASAPADTTVPAPETAVLITPAAEGQAAPAPAKPTEIAQGPAPTPEQTAVMLDLHWLIHQGAVLEFADGRMETAKKPLPKPEKKPEKKPDKKAPEKPAADATIAAPGAPTTAEAPPAQEAAPAPEEAAPANVQNVAAESPAPEAASETPAAAAPAEAPAAAQEAVPAPESPAPPSNPPAA